MLLAAAQVRFADFLDDFRHRASSL